jgi:YjbE family integral membrane protein
MAVMWLLMIPGLKLLGGLLLIWIAYKLLAGKKGHGPLNPVGSMWKAMGTIIVADTAMGLDNVLAIAGAAHGHLLLIVIGLIISIPIMVYGSTLVIKLIKRFPVALYIGAGVLAWTAGSMIAEEPLLGIAEIPLLKWGVTAFVTVASLAAGKLRNHMRQRSLPHIAAEKGGSHHG